MEKLLFQVSCYSVLIPLLLGLIAFRKVGRQSQKIVFICMLASIPQLTAAWFPEFPYRWIVYNIYTLLDAILMLWFLSALLTSSFGRKSFLTGMFICFITALLFIVKYSLLDFQNYWVCVNTFVYVLLILAVFAQRISEFQEKLLDFTLSETWYVIALLLYGSSTELVMLLYKFIKANPQSGLSVLSNIHHVFNTLFYCMLAIGVLIDFKNNRTPIPAKKLMQIQHL